MNFFKIFILTWSFSVFGESTEFVNCNREASLIHVAPKSIDLAKDIQGIVGSTPLFCREALTVADTKEDKELAHFIKARAKKQSVKIIDFEIEKMVFNTLQYVAFKKLWANTNEKTREQIYVTHSCSYYPLNKFPEFIYEKAPQDKKANMELIEKITPICKAYDFPKLAPFLTKEVISESMLILSDAYPNSFAQVSSHLCELFKNNPEALLKVNDETKSLLKSSLNEDQKKFSSWYVDLLNYTPAHSNWLLGDKFIIRLNDKMQLQGRAKDNQVITYDQQLKILDYTNREFQRINTCLRTNDCVDDSKEMAESIQQSLSALKKSSDGKELTLFRGVGIPPTFLEKLVKDNLDTETPFVFDKGFMSTTGQAKTAVAFSGHGPDSKAWMVIVKAKSCIGIDLYAREKSEDEFLCPAGMKVKAYKTEMPNVYELREAYE